MFRYPGGKAKLTNEITVRLRAYVDSSLQYREPFFGGGSIGISLFQHPARLSFPGEPDGVVRAAWINDADAGIAALWTAVIRHPREVIDRVLNFQPSAEAFRDFKAELLNTTKVADDCDSIVDIGFKKLATHQMSYSGLGTRAGGPMSKIDARWTPARIAEEVAAVHSDLSRVEVYHDACTCLDFETLISDTGRDCILYVDPPYFEKGNDLYQYGFAVADHERLAAALRRTPHYWLLSYDDCPEIRELYKWASLVSLDVKYSITGEKQKRSVYSLEGDVVELNDECVSRSKPELLISV
jgi:DNA adenine methylase